MQKKLRSIFQGHSRSVTIKKNIAASFFIKGVSILVSLLLVPLTIGYISSEQYGIWLTLSSIVAWAAFFDIGFGNGLRNRLSESYAKGDLKKAKEYISTTYFFMLILFFLVFVILRFSVSFINWSSLLNVDSTLNEELIKTLQVIIAFFCLQMVFKAITTILTATHKPALASAIDTLGQLLTLIVIFVFTQLLPPSLPILAVALGFSPILILIIASIFLFKGKYKRIAPSISHIKIYLVRDILGLGLKFFIIQIAVLVLYQTTNVIISNVSGPEAVTVYNVAYKYFSISIMIFGIIITPMWSAFTDAYSKLDYVWMISSYRKLCRAVFMIIGITIVMLFISPIVFKLWLGNKVLVPFSMSIIITGYVCLSIWNNLHAFLINGIGAIKLQLYISLAAIVFNIPLALYFGHLWGAIGVVASMIVFSIIPAIVLKIQTNKILSTKANGIWLK